MSGSLFQVENKTHEQRCRGGKTKQNMDWLYVTVCLTGF